ncbi:MAG TPA: hypothetical protein VKE98_09455 [Gemmataceae bacterium]|nr:hypothetical protein [Gemmataceae bacterium]
MNTTPNPLDTIPKSDSIRDMIAERIREASLLRGLLRVAEQRERQRTSQDARRRPKREAIHA